MLEIVAEAERLGYRIRWVGVEEIGLTRSAKGSWTDVTIKGRFINAQALRDILVPVSETKP